MTGVRTIREAALLLVLMSLAVGMALRARPVSVPPSGSLVPDIAATLLSAPECHCGPPHVPTSGRHDYRGYAEADLLPVGFAPEHFRLYEQRHCRAYVDWWNVDEGLLAASAAEGDRLILQSMSRARRSAQSVILGRAHHDTVLGLPRERLMPSPLLDRLAEAAGSPTDLHDALLRALPPGEGWLVVGADLRTGEIHIARPDAEASLGLWSAQPVVVIDCHRTAHLFDFGADEAALRSYFDCVWPQVNRRAVEERAVEAQRLAGGDLGFPDSITPLSAERLADLNTIALGEAEVILGGSVDATLGQVMPSALSEPLADLLGEEWPSILERWVALAPKLAVLGVVAETGEVALFHVADPAREGVWGVVPVAAFTPDQAEQLAAVDWPEINVRLDRWRVH